MSKEEVIRYHAPWLSQFARFGSPRKFRPTREVSAREACFTDVSKLTLVIVTGASNEAIRGYRSR